MLPEIFFLYNAIAITGVSAFIVTRRNAMHSVILMLILFFHIAGLYLFLNAEFLAAIQIIVYAGAILVLFLFTILLLNLRSELMKDMYIRHWGLGFLAAAVLLILMFGAIKTLKLGPVGEYSIARIQEESHVVVLGKLLYTEFIFPFELASVVLLVAIIGAIVIAKKELKT